MQSIQDQQNQTLDQSDDAEIHLHITYASHFDMDEAFCARMRAAIDAGLENAPIGVVTTPGTCAGIKCTSGRPRCTSAGPRAASPQSTLSAAMNCACCASCSGTLWGPLSSRPSAAARLPLTPSIAS